MMNVSAKIQVVFKRYKQYKEYIVKIREYDDTRTYKYL